MKDHAIVFDFDGTIADSERIIIKIYHYFAAKNNRPKLTEEQKKKLRDGSPKEAIRWAGVKFWQIPGIVRLARDEYKKRSSNVKIFPGIRGLLENLSDDFDIYILSTNSEKTVKKILSKNNLKTEVTILKGSSVFGKGKALKRLMKSGKYETKGCWMVGDEVRDIEAGKKARMKTIGVTWGLQSKKGLKRANPDYVVDSLSKLAKILI